MTHCYWIIRFVLVSFLFRVYEASLGDSDPLYRACVAHCENTGCVRQRCFSHCNLSSDDSSSDGLEHFPKTLFFWKPWDCQSDCRYHCMLDRESERAKLGQRSLKYHGKWPFRRLYNLQEPISVAFSILNFAIHFHGWLSFCILLYYKLPQKPDKRLIYDYTGLWNIYGLLSMNSWFWSAVFHSRDVDVTEKLDYSSAVALLGYSLILAIIRSCGLRGEAARVMVSTPLIAFTTTHILYLNNYQMDYGWNMQVCIFMAIAQLLIWSIWAHTTNHPSRRKLWIVTGGGSIAMLLEIFDFPPFLGLVDAHALWHACTVPLTYVWWSFVLDDAVYLTSNFIKKVT